MTRRTGVLRAGALAGAASLLLSGCGLSLQALPKLGASTAKSYPVNAIFSDVLNLPLDGQVRIGPEVVGTVKNIVPDGYQAKVTMGIDEGVQIPAGTTATVRFDDPLGDEYVLLTPPAGAATGSYLTADAVIPDTATTTAPSVEDVLAALSAVLDGGGLTQIQTIVTELDKVFSGNEPQIRTLLSQVAYAAGQVASGAPSVDAALAAMRSLSAGLASNSGVFAAGITAAIPAVNVIQSETSQIQTLLTNFSALGQEANAVVVANSSDMVADFKALLPVANQLVGIDQQLGPDLQDLANFEHNFPAVIPGAYLQVGVTVHVELPTGNFEPSVPTAGAAAASAAPPGSNAAVRSFLLNSLI